MSETSEEVPQNIIDEYGDTIDQNPRRKSWIRDQLDGALAMFNWAVENIRRGNHLPVKPGQVTRNLDDLRSKLQNAEEITVGKKGEILPKPQNSVE